jgi:hypothetical protein
VLSFRFRQSDCPLLEQRGKEIKITEGIVNAAVKNSSNRCEVLRLLLEHGGEEVRITERTVITPEEHDSYS